MRGQIVYEAGSYRETIIEQCATGARGKHAHISLIECKDGEITRLYRLEYPDPGGYLTHKTYCMLDIALEAYQSLVARVIEGQDITDDDAVYLVLLRTFETVREPGRNALFLDLSHFAQTMRTKGVFISTDRLRRSLRNLQDEGRLEVNVINSPPNAPGSWMVRFLNLPHLPYRGVL